VWIIRNYYYYLFLLPLPTFDIEGSVYSRVNPSVNSVEWMDGVVCVCVCMYT
jgi:hypothetical protein